MQSRNKYSSTICSAHLLKFMHTKEKLIYTYPQTFKHKLFCWSYEPVPKYITSALIYQDEPAPLFDGFNSSPKSSSLKKNHLNKFLKLC